MVVGQELINRKVTLELHEQPASVIMDALSRVLLCEVRREGDVWYVGATRETDKVILIRRVRGIEVAKVPNVISTLGVAAGSFVDLGQGVVLFAAGPDVISRVDRILNDIENAERPQWAIQLHLVTLTMRDLTDLGMNVSPSLDIAVHQAVGSRSLVEPLRLDAGLRAVLAASQQRGSVRVVAQPVFLVLDGGKAKFSRERRMPYRTRVVTQSGAVQDSGVSFVTAGTTIDLSIRELGPTLVLADVVVELSEIGEVIDGALPQVESRNHTAQAALEDGGCYLLASMEIDSQRRSGGTWFKFGMLEDRSQEVLQVWARAVAVDGRTPLEDNTTRLPPVEVVR